MARFNFQDLINRASQRISERAANIQARLLRRLNRNNATELITDLAAPGKGNTQQVIEGIARYLARLGPGTVRLIKSNEGKLIDRTDARINAIRELQAQAKADLQLDLNRYRDNRIDIETLQRNIQATLRRQTLTAAIIGVGGIGNLTENVLTAIRRQLSVQFKYLDGFIDDIAGRTVTQKDRNRLAQYANAAYAISQTASRQFNLDNNLASVTELEERRRLGGTENCDDCIGYAEDGWQPAGTLPPIGQGSVCNGSCQCYFEVRQRTTDSPDSPQEPPGETNP